MKKDIFRKLHLWLSVPFGLVMVITCLTGAILVFEDEVTALCNKDVATVEAKGDPLPFRTLVESVEKSLPDGVSVSGVVVSVVSQTGDLIMSVIKRHYNIKDYGKILPGHGGILDRFDSVMAVSLVLAVICTYFNLFS